MFKSLPAPTEDLLATGIKVVKQVRAISCAVSIAFLGVVFTWYAIKVTVGSRAVNDRMTCLGHLRQIGTSLAGYVADWDDRFPPKEHWETLIGRELGACRITTLKCPSSQAPFGYLYNSQIAGGHLDEVVAPVVESQSCRVVLFEHDSASMNGFGEGRATPPAQRHIGGTNMLFADFRAGWRNKSGQLPVVW